MHIAVTIVERYAIGATAAVQAKQVARSSQQLHNMDDRGSELTSMTVCRSFVRHKLWQCSPLAVQQSRQRAAWPVLRMPCWWQAGGLHVSEQGRPRPSCSVCKICPLALKKLNAMNWSH